MIYSSLLYVYVCIHREDQLFIYHTMMVSKAHMMALNMYVTPMVIMLYTVDPLYKGQFRITYFWQLLLQCRSFPLSEVKNVLVGPKFLPLLCYYFLNSEGLLREIPLYCIFGTLICDL